MGDFRVREIRSDQERNQFYHQALRDLEAFEHMLREGLIIDADQTIGAEQELCLIDAMGEPSASSLPFLQKIDDGHYTNELAQYNLEINLDPMSLQGNCFSNMEQHLLELLQKGQTVASEQDARIFMTGILPSLHYRHLDFRYMTPEPRYRTLSNELLKMRGGHFEIYLQGVDDFNSSLNSVLFEACNTSFQTHLQIRPKHFVSLHNWSQMIAGPVLAFATNSPLLFGKELWAENRIPLFKQSLDTRSSKNHARVNLSRVYFGRDWLRSGPAELWKNDIMRFPAVLWGEGEPDALEELRAGRIPSLRSIRLHNGTTYTWNRLCYGVHQNQAHIRIECRYLPAGPTTVDEIANFALWVGLMKGLQEEDYNFWKEVDFSVAKSNFIHAARNGSDCIFEWFGQRVSAQSLLLDTLLPMAASGLEQAGVADSDIRKYLGIIEQRALSMASGSNWLVEQKRLLSKKHKPSVVARLLVQESAERQAENIPVHRWTPVQSVNPSPALRAEDKMNSEIISVNESTSLCLAGEVMRWRNIHQLIVEDHQENLIGILTDGLVQEGLDAGASTCHEAMSPVLVSVRPETELSTCRQIMQANKIRYLIVMENQQLVGILTENDL
jgi:CBS domain-containing protein